MGHQELELLVSLQDIDLMIEESEEVEKLGFPITGCSELKIAREELAEKISKPLVYRYERLRGKFKRAIVPVKMIYAWDAFCASQRPSARKAAKEWKYLPVKTVGECCTGWIKKALVFSNLFYIMPNFLPTLLNTSKTISSSSSVCVAI